MAQRKTNIQPAPEPDMVNSPGHYQDHDGRGPEEGGVECVDAIRSALGRDGLVAYLRGSLISQTWRLTRKDDGKGGAQDAAKAAWYATKLAEILAEEV